MSCKLQYPYNLPDHAKQSIRKLIFDLKNKWHKSKRTESIFLNTYSEWLGVYISFGLKEENKTKRSTRGRPSTSFEDSSERSKRRKTENFRTQSTTEELSYATQMNLRAEGKQDAAKILKDVTSNSPSKAKKYRSSFEYVQEDNFNADKALSLYIELKFSRNKYQQLRNACLRKRSKLFPSYKEIILKSKKNCYPKSEIILTETSAEIKLQPLLDHTTSRILLTQLDVIKCLTDQQLENLFLICKWGCDGSSGQSRYKQKFSDESKTDESVFFTSIVPLQLTHTNKVTNKTTVIWKNPRPSSPRFCRPIRIQFLHETTEITIQETDYIKKNK